MFSNLKAEMARKGVTCKSLSAEIGISAKTLGSKLAGKTEFTLSEMLKIRSRCFPSLSLEYLFEKEKQNIA